MGGGVCVGGCMGVGGGVCVGGGVGVAWVDPEVWGRGCMHGWRSMCGWGLHGEVHVIGGLHGWRGVCGWGCMDGGVCECGGVGGCMGAWRGVCVGGGG